MRDPRGCGQDFYYDRAARLVAEDYISCGESRGEYLTELVQPLDAIGLDETVADGRSIDVRYVFDDAGSLASEWDLSAFGEVTASAYLGRLVGVLDRGQRSALAYDDRGQVVWTVREMAVIADAGPEPTVTTAADGSPVITEPVFVASYVSYDTDHPYERTASYDHGGRPTSMTLPLDPDYAGGGAPLVGGALTYNARGLPSSVGLSIGGVPRDVVSALGYTRDGLVETVTYGDSFGGRTPTTSSTTYDDRRRPIRMRTEREPTGAMDLDRPLSAVSAPHDQMLVWDLADNLVAIEDLRDPREWPAGFRPQSVAVTHDSLYRVAGAEYEYTHDDGSRSAADDGTDWRDAQADVRAAGADPMDSEPAPMVGDAPTTRVTSMTWAYDWLGNMNEWTDDASSFYERSLGDILNGADFEAMDRPGSLRLAANLDAAMPSTNRGGWVEVSYGRDGNVLSITAHASCADLGASSCLLPAAGDEASRRAALRASCACAEEQHYTYAWDEVNRIAEARRFDRAGEGSWSLAVRQRYLYDSANQRTVKQTITPDPGMGDIERVALYVFPGDFERRGLEVVGGTYAPTGRAETQYVVGGARIVWRADDDMDPGLDRDQRVTIALTDLIQSTTAVLDLVSGEIVETGSYYANGARETYRTNGETVGMEPMGFTGKEADEEVGLTYFGQRYLMAHLGRWASPDPLQTHAVGGGEAVNGYHYLGGSLLGARDPMGLTIEPAGWVEGSGRYAPHERTTADRPSIDRMVTEYRAMVQFEAAWRANAVIDEAEAREAAGEAVDWDDVTSRATGLLERGDREAAAITYSDDTGHIEIADVYEDARRGGAARSELGGTVYERLLYLARSPEHVVVGYWTPSDDARARGMMGGTVRVSDDTIATWMAPWEFRGRGYAASTEAPEYWATGVHEATGHAYYMLLGLDDEHGADVHGGRGRGVTEDNAMDIYGHWLNDVAGTPEAYAHPDGSIPHVTTRADAYGNLPTYAYPDESGGAN